MSVELIIQTIDIDFKMVDTSGRLSGSAEDQSTSASSNPSYVQRVSATNPEKKCFVKIVAIGDSGVGKTSCI